MKINNVGPIKINPYNKQLDKIEKTEISSKRDKIEISAEAMELQKGNSIEMERLEKVEQIKEKVQTGEYEIKPKEVARKLYDFWNL